MRDESCVKELNRYAHFDGTHGERFHMKLSIVELAWQHRTFTQNTVQWAMLSRSNVSTPVAPWDRTRVVAQRGGDKWASDFYEFLFRWFRCDFSNGIKWTSANENDRKTTVKRCIEWSNRSPLAYVWGIALQPATSPMINKFHFDKLRCSHCFVVRRIFSSLYKKFPFDLFRVLANLLDANGLESMFSFQSAHFGRTCLFTN